jgi:vancomycin permeability regulator SanA
MRLRSLLALGQNLGATCKGYLFTATSKTSSPELLQKSKNNMPKRQVKIIMVCASVVLVLFVAAAGVLVWAGLTAGDTVSRCDVAVVFGNKVEKNGTPSARLRARLDAAVYLYGQGLCPVILVSGGIGKEGYDEAAVMRDYLLGKGIPAAKIISDNQGDNTMLTARNATAMAKQSGWHSALAVSQYFHIPRTRMALRRAGFKRVDGYHARYSEWRDIYSIAREVVGFVVYALSRA